VSVSVVCVVLIWDCRVEIWEWSFRVREDGNVADAGAGAGADAGPGVSVVWPEGDGGVLKSVGMEAEIASRRGDVCADVNGEAGGLVFGGRGITPLGSGSMCAAVEGTALVTGVAPVVD
jgi:hypothetical protein